MDNPSIKIAIIILNWNGSNDTITCLESLSDQTYTNYKIILVDNGSEQDSRAVLDTFVKGSKLPITYLKNSHNLGFAGGVNTGISHAISQGFDAVALLNNDATVDSEWLHSLVNGMQSDDIGIVTGALLHDNKQTIDSTGEFYSIWGLTFPRGRGQLAVNIPEAGYIFGATGGSTLYRTSLFKAIGLFDESFFAYYEDVDISFRAQLAGWRVYFTPLAITYHKQGATSRKIPGFGVYQTFKNLPLLYRKNIPSGLRRIVGLRFYLAYTLIFVNAIKNGNVKPALKGVIQSIQLIPHALRERKQIQATKTVSNAYIQSILWPDLPPEQTGLRKFRKIFTGKD